MNYNKLEILRDKEKNLKLFAKKIGMTEQGVSKMLTNKTITVERLEHICIVYNVPIISFFEAEYDSLNEPQATYGQAKQDEKDSKVELLLDMLREKDEEIARLNRELGRKAAAKNKGVA